MKIEGEIILVNFDRFGIKITFRKPLNEKTLLLTYRYVTISIDIRFFHYHYPA